MDGTIPTPFGLFKPSIIQGKEVNASRESQCGRQLSPDDDEMEQRDAQADRAVKVRIVRVEDVDRALEAQRVEVAALFTEQMKSLTAEHRRELGEMNDALRTALAQVEEVRTVYSNQTREAENEVAQWRQHALKLEAKFADPELSMAEEMKIFKETISGYKEKLEELDGRNRERDERLRNQRQIIETLRIELVDSGNEMRNVQLQYQEQEILLQRYRGNIQQNNDFDSLEEGQNHVTSIAGAENMLVGDPATVSGDQEMAGLDPGSPSDQEMSFEVGGDVSPRNRNTEDQQIMGPDSVEGRGPERSEDSRERELRSPPTTSSEPYLHHRTRQTSLGTFSAAIRSRPTLADIYEARREANITRNLNRNIPTLTREQSAASTPMEHNEDEDSPEVEEPRGRSLSPPAERVKFATTEDTANMESRILNAVLKGRQSTGTYRGRRDDPSDAESDKSVDGNEKNYGISSKDKNCALPIVRQVFSERLRYNKDIEFITHVPIGLDVAKEFETRKGAVGPIPNDLHMDITSSSLSWNHAALSLLVSDIRTRNGDRLRGSVTNDILYAMCFKRWKRLLLRFHESIPKMTAEGVMETSLQVAHHVAGKVVQSGQEERRRVRRRTKYINRTRVCSESTKRIRQIAVELRSDQQKEELQLWEFIIGILEKLAVEGMSSDASMHLENQQTIYKVHILGWRSNRVSNLLYWLDSQYQKVKAGSGSSGRVRAGPATLSQRTHQQKLPRCFYDDEWFESNKDILRIHVSRKEFEWIELNLPS